jgi:diadenosine tetraphosphate (Ap4A) HIT family hydrolase
MQNAPAGGVRDTASISADTCQICQKHRSAGPLKGMLVAVVDGFWVYHAPGDDAGRAALGYLFIESDRHAPYLADLTDEEAAALGRIRSRLAAELRRAIDTEVVLAAVIGRGIAHFHEHLFVRHEGTAAEVPWYASDEAAPRADEGQVSNLVNKLRIALARE